ncbi:hypothetical protein N7510_005174 [Penicillium lagena]|uniref:uncharacterized protein n=1 Tax=Penicillium lagena TaxID=94218 RepID=UPI0025405452|nr:uncharacterized protein N7510_005174 [Penicillium lagena]KAJ5611980.1 hypothetical protein N7510_005174 [Penicillium lagena]
MKIRVYEGQLSEISVPIGPNETRTVDAAATSRTRAGAGAEREQRTSLIQLLLEIVWNLTTPGAEFAALYGTSD